MVIYYLYLNGKFRFKTNSIEDILEVIRDNDRFQVNIDYVFDGLITKHEYHYYDSTGRRKIDVVCSING